MNMLSWYRDLPILLHSPIVFQWDGFEITWYALAYLVSFGVGFWGVFSILKATGKTLSLDDCFDLVISILAGVLIGGRLGFVFFYQFDWFLAHPLYIVWPFDVATGMWTGIAGMSYHGGLIGAAIGLYWFTRTHALEWLFVIDAVVLFAPIGSLLGRLANFVNGELYGRATASAWGMYFPSDPEVSRFPSQLFEAFGEGVLLLLFLWWMKKYSPVGEGKLATLYLIGYGVIRFFTEYFREPDPQIGLFLGGLFSLGQILSFFMIISGYLFWRYLKIHVILERS